MQICYPLANSQILTVEQWSKMAQHYVGTGFVMDLGAYADSTGMQVKVRSGQAFIQGHFYESDAEEVLAIGPADATNPRIDRVIIRLDWTTSVAQLTVLQGTPNVSPTAPALTQNSTRWEITVAQVRVNAGVATIAASDITDERNYFNLNIKDSRNDGVYYAFNEDEHTGKLALKSRYVGDSTFKKYLLTGTEDGILSFPNHSAIFGGRNADISISSGVNTKVVWDFESVDQASENVNGTVTLKESGVYLITVNSQTNEIPSGIIRHIVYVNGVQSIVNDSGYNQKIAESTTVRKFNAGDVLEFYFYHAHSAAATLLAYYVSIVKVA